MSHHTDNFFHLKRTNHFCMKILAFGLTSQAAWSLNRQVKSGK